MTFLFSLILFAVCAFLQNMAFTAVSRSRNSGDPSYHRKCAYFSNSIWFITNFFIMKQVWEVLQSNWSDWWKLVLVIAIYTVATAEGSVVMMKRLLKTETGKRQVGAR